MFASVDIGMIMGRFASILFGIWISCTCTAENISVEESDGVKTMVVLATNVYRRSNDGWRMILHHASPAPADSNVAPMGRMH